MTSLMHETISSSTSLALFLNLIGPNNLLQASLSLPGSPFTLRRSSKTSQFSWKPGKHGPRTNDRQPLVLPYLDIYNLNLPYADDSNAVTPTSDELCNSQNTQNFLPGRRRLSSTSYNSNKFLSGSRRSSFASHYSRQSYASYGDYSFKIKDKHKEPTHFHWNTSVKNRATHPLLPEVVVDKSKSDDNVSTFFLRPCAVYSTADGSSDELKLFQREKKVDIQTFFYVFLRHSKKIGDFFTKSVVFGKKIIKISQK